MKSFDRAGLREWALDTPEKRAETVRLMQAAETMGVEGDFSLWAHEGQRPPEDRNWRTWLLMGGRGYGKTRAGAEWVHEMAMAAGDRSIALVGATIAEARAIMVEGRSGLVRVAADHDVRLTFEASRGVLRWPNGSCAHLYSGESPEGLRGPEHHAAWCDEIAKWGRASDCWDNLQLGLRAGERPRVLVTTTPRPTDLMRRLLADPATIVTGGRSEDNLALPAAFIEAMQEAYGSSRTGRQELDGEMLDEVSGSLFPRALIERQRVGAAPECERIVVGVDPPASSRGDACGIIAAGVFEDRIYVLADASVERPSPEAWARAVARVAEEFGADRVVAEANQGGDMVESVLRAANAMLPVKLVHASRGKAARAEPVAALFESQRGWLAGRFDRLEDELAGMTMSEGYQGPGRSPDRADAMIWAMHALMADRSGPPTLKRL